MPNLIIDYVRRGPQRAIHAGLNSRRFGVVVAHRRMGKTVCMINHLIRTCVQCKERAPHMAYVAPQLKQAKAIAWDYLKHYTQDFPQRRVNESELSVTLPTGGKIRLYGSDNPDSLRGLYFDGVVIDETAQIKPDAWTEVIRPALSDRMGYACFIGTPKGVNLFYELYLQALGDPDNWYCEVFRASETGLIKPEELAVIRTQVSEAHYRQEFECDFTASELDILIPLDLVQPCIDRNIKQHEYQHAPHLMGVDVGGEGEDASSFVIRQGLKLLHIESHHGLTTTEVATQVQRLHKEWAIDHIFTDTIGIGAGVYHRLLGLGYDDIYSVKGSARPSDTKHHNLRMEMWFRMREWFEAGADIPRHTALIAGATSPKFKADELTGKLKLETKEHMREDRGLKSPDEADALAHTFAYAVDPGWDDEFGEEHREVEREETVTGY